jgi:HPt (histidine-containing phosphotransfer) domain-containing protein
MTAGGGGPLDRIIVPGDPDLRELIPGYLENRRKELPRLREALAQNDFPAIQRLAHRMKGEGGGYGFDAISAIGLGLERAANERDTSAIHSGLEELGSYLDRVQVVYDE